MGRDLDLPHRREGAARGPRGRRRLTGAAVGALLALALLAGPAPADGGGAAAPTGGNAGAAPERPQIGPVTRLPLPRYVSLRAAKVNARRGPGLDYRVDWVFQRPGLPVRVIDEYGNWRRVVDADEAGGWVYHALLSRRRTALVTAETVVLRAAPEPEAPPRARAERGVVARLLECRPAWCRIEAEGIRGWVPKAAIWGADPDEVFED